MQNNLHNEHSEYNQASSHCMHLRAYLSPFHTTEFCFLTYKLGGFDKSILNKHFIHESCQRKFGRVNRLYHLHSHIFTSAMMEMDVLILLSTIANWNK